MIKLIFIKKLSKIQWKYETLFYHKTFQWFPFFFLVLFRIGIKNSCKKINSNYLTRYVISWALFSDWKISLYISDKKLGLLTWGNKTHNLYAWKVLVHTEAKNRLAYDKILVFNPSIPCIRTPFIDTAPNGTRASRLLAAMSNPRSWEARL